ncbi:hypothetical protein LCGC14_0537070 [marine sediment metagenome]|uniref:Four helix bundle protein n=1 Tax=marine sediment metagenome TaxID=412755 RepID=A0A0F9SCE8_9ZZZZ
MKGVKLSSKQFSSFIDRNYRKPLCVQKGAIKQQSWVQLRLITENSMRGLGAMSKNTTPEERIVLNELIELKLKELDIIYNHIKRR